MSTMDGVKLFEGPVDLDEYADQNDLDLLKADGFDGCAIGIGDREGVPVLAYSFDKIITQLMEEDDIDYEDAVEHFYFNIEGAYMGPLTPVYVYENEIDGDGHE